jgi:hypothetical protein
MLYLITLWSFNAKLIASQGSKCWWWNWRFVTENPWEHLDCRLRKSNLHFRRYWVNGTAKVK